MPTFDQWVLKEYGSWRAFYHAMRNPFGKEHMSEKTEFYRVRNVNGQYFGPEASDPTYGRTCFSAFGKYGALKFLTLSDVVAACIAVNGQGFARNQPYTIEHVTVTPGERRVIVRDDVSQRVADGFAVLLPTGHFITDPGKGTHVVGSRTTAESLAASWGWRNPCEYAVKQVFVVDGEPTEVVREVK